MPIGDILSGALSAGSPAGQQFNTSPTRVAMKFTSRLRSIGARTQQLLAGGLSESSVGAADLDAASFLIDAGPLLMPTISMAVNPNSVKFSQPKRWTKRDTREGSVFFHFTNSKGQNNDILTLSFAGNTGNIDARGSQGDPNQAPSNAQQETSNASIGSGDTGAVNKLIVWHNLYLLSREPMLLPDGTENIISVSYRSALFALAQEIIFNGFFTKVVEFDESGTKPNSRNYSFEITVTSTFPDLDDVLSILGAQMSTQALPLNDVPQVSAIANPPGNFISVQQRQAAQAADAAAKAPGLPGASDTELPLVPGIGVA
jgi:hypothetical protein